MKKAIVIGSGFSGSMFAMMLKEKNWDVKVIDKSKITHLHTVPDILSDLSQVDQLMNFLTR